MENDIKNRSEFNNADEAFDFLVSEKQRQLQKERWKKEMGKYSEKGTQKPKRTRRIVSMISGIAASALLILGVWIFNQSPSLGDVTTSMIAESSVLLPKDISTRGSANEGDTGLEEMINQSFENKEFKELVLYFQNELNPEELNAQQKFYYAIALLKTNSPIQNEAVLIFEEVENNLPVLKYECQWFKSLTLLQLNETQLAKAELIKLSQSSNYQKDNVEELLKSLN